ncbi:phage tail protein [Priestia megaterium]|uniref:prophage endopeptidase tail family protein n=1 Tax=Priestia megaterium TaxID=1404 RepID=UPI00203E88F2|nr:prophage endopeptidase tail family protein [Priestia megaterium]MCM3792511.1 phage tail protein [Priestia megaterium]
MFVISLDKTKKERLVNYRDLSRKWKVNDLSSISFSIFRDNLNKDSYDLLVDEAQIEFDDVKYVIKSSNEIVLGETCRKTITTEHEFFTKMRDEFVYTALPTSKKSLNEYMSFITQNVGYTFSIISSFDTKEIENFGGDNPLSLFNKLIDAFKFEFNIVGNDIRIYERIGSQTSYPYRYRHNLSDIVKNFSSQNLSTYIRGFGKPYEQKDILPSTSYNFTSRTGTWADTVDPYWYTDQVGSTFTFTYTGTGVRFFYWADTNGGIWELKLDGVKIATVSTWNDTQGIKSSDLFRDATEGSHTIVATFKGDDPKHVPSSGKGKGKGWVRYQVGAGTKTFQVWRNRTGDEQYMATAEYESPLAAIYGRRHQTPIYDEKFTNSDHLKSYIRENLNDKVEISYESTFTDLKKAGYDAPSPRIGDSIPFICEPLKLTIPDIRIMEIDEYPEQDKSPTIVLGNSRKTFGEASFNATKAQLDTIFDANKGRIKHDVLPEATKQATDLINNSATDLEYPVGGGIIGRDPNDYNRFTKFTSAGIGITTNGGVTYDNAITPNGINTQLLVAGQIKTNNIQVVGQDNLFYWDQNYLIAIDANNPDKFVRLNSDGLYVKGGAFVVERPDGYKSINNGILQYDFNVQGMTPQFCDPAVTVAPRFCYTNKTDAADFQAYDFRHQGRYLRVNVAMYQGGGGTCYMSVESTYEGKAGWKRWALVSSTVTADQMLDGDSTSREMLIDLGVPSGNFKRLYVRIWSSKSTVTAYGRITGIWQEG